MVVQVNIMHQLQMFAVKWLSQQKNAHRYRISFSVQIDTDDYEASICMRIFRRKDQTMIGYKLYDFWAVRQDFSKSGQLDRTVQLDVTRIVEKWELDDVER